MDPVRLDEARVHPDSLRLVALEAKAATVRLRLFSVLLNGEVEPASQEESVRRFRP